MAINAGLASSAVNFTPDDATRVSYSSIFVGGAGTVVIEPLDKPGTKASFNVPAGGYVLCQSTHVYAESTATELVGLT